MFAVRLIAGAAAGASSLHDASACPASIKRSPSTSDLGLTNKGCSDAAGARPVRSIPWSEVISLRFVISL
jgi:hypothetical protein